MLGERIKEVRTEKGITQQQLADSLSVAKSTIGMWETDKREPDLETIKRISEILDYPMAFLLNETIKIGDEFSSDTTIEHSCPLCGCKNIRITDAKLADFFKSSKSSGYALKFWCESEHFFYIVVENYKGSNYVTYTDENFNAVKSVLAEKKSSIDEKMNCLDAYGRKAVRDLLDTEYERCGNTLRKPIFNFRRLSENKVSAGTGFDLNDPDQWRSVDVVDTPEARKADFAVKVEGASMEPDYHNGDIVYISLASEVPLGQVGLFIQNGKGYIKEAGEDRLISRNPEYDDIFPADGNIECKGFVIGIAELAE